MPIWTSEAFTLVPAHIPVFDLGTHVSRNGQNTVCGSHGGFSRACGGGRLLCGSAYPATAENKKKLSEQPYKVLEVSTGEILEVPVRDYVIGAVCAEMPASFHSEALKAQAAAAHTYAERQRMHEQKFPTPELCGADFSTDVSQYQGYYTKEQAKQFFGADFEKNYQRISDAADEVMDYVITYNDEPIISAFHSMSPGMTPLMVCFSKLFTRKL